MNFTVSKIGSTILALSLIASSGKGVESLSQKENLSPPALSEADNFFWALKTLVSDELNIAIPKRRALQNYLYKKLCMGLDYTYEISTNMIHEISTNMIPLVPVVHPSVTRWQRLIEASERLREQLDLHYNCCSNYLNYKKDLPFFKILEINLKHAQEEVTAYFTAAVDIVVAYKAGNKDQLMEEIARADHLLTTANDALKELESRVSHYFMDNNSNNYLFLKDLSNSINVYKKSLKYINDCEKKLLEAGYPLPSEKGTMEWKKWSNYIQDVSYGLKTSYSKAKAGIRQAYRQINTFTDRVDSSGDSLLKAISQLEKDLRKAIFEATPKHRIIIQNVIKDIRGTYVRNDFLNRTLSIGEKRTEEGILQNYSGDFYREWWNTKLEEVFPNLYPNEKRGKSRDMNIYPYCWGN